MGRWLEIVGIRLRTLTRRKRVERELSKELRFHLDRQTEEYIAAGMTPEDARRAALRRIGGLTQIEEECRDMRRTNWIDSLWQDLRYSLRALSGSPGFFAIMVATLTLAIGANSAIFSVIDGVLLRKLPYPDQNRIVRFFLTSASYPRFPINPFDFQDFRARNRLFESMAIMSRSDLQLSGAGEPQRLTGFRVSAGYFRVIGVEPARGREFSVNDERPKNERVAILSDRIWRTRFGADLNILGKTIRLDARPFTVVGVMPARMQHPGNEYRPVPYGDTVDVWWPFTFEGDPSDRGSHYTEGIGRVKPGVTVEQASAEMNALMAQLANEHPGDRDWRVLVVPLYREIVGANQRMLLVLLGAVGLVLLIACANAANLLLARATGRQREMAVRAALGAARGRLIRQMLTESLLISVLGGVCGTLLAILGTQALVKLLPPTFPRAQDIHMDLGVFAFTLGIALVTGVVFGLVPALQVSRTDLQQSLRESGRSTTGGARQLRLRNWLVIAEVSLACVLLIGAGLMLRSFVNLMRSDPGFRPEHVLTAAISLPDETYRTEETKLRFYQQLSAKLESMPGVRASGLGTDLPWTGYDDNMGGWQIEGKKPPPQAEFHARYHAAGVGYFQALGIPLLHGRFFTGADLKDARKVLIINREMAERYWPGEDVIGKRINFYNDHPSEKDWTTVVGVVGDVKDTPEKSAAEPAFWWPLQQTPNFFPSILITVRAESNPAFLASEVRNAVRDVDPTLALAEVRFMDQIADASVSTPRFTLFLVGLFAALAITLAAIGTYGVISYSVNQRTQEFGMRVALGAKPADVLLLVLRQGLRLVAAGVVIGAVSALALARILRGLLYEVSAYDPLTFSIVPVLALLIAILACYLPARRATQADPVVALRSE